MSNIAILLGGGEGTRMEGYVEDKILAILQGKPVFAYSIEAFIESKVVDTLMIVYKNDHQKMIIEEWINNELSFPHTQILWSLGGKRRQDSVFNALKAVPQKTDYVFIHDLARPLLRPKTVKELYQSLLQEGASVLARPVIDTIKQIFPESKKLNDLNRNTLWTMETPQAFKYSLIYDAHIEVEKNNLEITDDAAAVSLINHPITIVQNSLPNPKITVQSDIHFIEYLITQNHYAPL